MPHPMAFPYGGDDGRRPTYNYQEQQQQHYDDPSARDMISPPPQYALPVTPEPPSPVFRSHAQPYSTNDPRLSPDISRESSPQRYMDRSPSPPPPPQHRISPSRHSRRDSIGRRPMVGQPIHMEDFARAPQDGLPRSQALSERLHTSGAHERRGIYPAQFNNGNPAGPSSYMQRPNSRLHEHSYGSNIPLAGGAATPGSMTPSDVRSSHYSGRSIPLDEYSATNPYRSSHHSYHDSPYHNSSLNVDSTVSNASINPQNIADDGEDDFTPMSHRQHPGAARSGGAATIGAAAGGGMLGGLIGHKAKSGAADAQYRTVDTAVEKDDWMARDNRKRKRNGWLCGIGIGIVILLAIIGGIVGGVVGTRSYKTQGGSINNANDDTAQNGDLDINSAEIKKLMNNPNLHKVFHGMDYTPWGVQYPLCETYPPSQNNITRDMAVLSQLTNTVRLYGTDCNQTEMVLHAIDRLKLKSMKVWLGVWVDTNQTTTNRQIAKMYQILSDVKDKSIFKGAIVGNEALYRAGEDKAQSRKELIEILKAVKSNFTSLGYTLPVATSDLGDNWDADLVTAVDYVMSNIHPFFAGVTAEKAAAWTLNFWNQHDVVLTANLPKVKQVISETGWPSGGGTDCGGTDGTCAAGQSGAVAGVAGMNTFMNDWVCQALANGTEYFWFEAFDEPWKIQFNTAGKEWEDKWGLMDAARNLKSGVKIPSCGGKTVP